MRRAHATLELLAGASVALAGGVAIPTAAQLSIQVVDAEGRPIPTVRIDVYGLGELIAVDSTSAQGVAELSSEQWSSVRRISLSHLGFQTLVVQAGDIPPDGVLRLEPQATPIDGLTVEARGELCPIANEPEARRLWSDVASLYAEDTGSRAWFARLSLYGGSVREQDLYRAPDSGTVARVAAGGPGTIHGGDHTPRSLDERISNEGYAWPPLVIDGTTSARELAWRYPELEWRHAHHFVSPVFGRLHDFTVASTSGERATLIFCANAEGNGATISGTIGLVPGEGLLTADWRFETDDRDEGAGGSVTFASLVERPGTPPHLVASRGLFYRRAAGERIYPDLRPRYSRWGIAEMRWHLLPSAARPCNTGLSFHGDPPSSTDARGIRFAACVAEHWRRE